MNPQKKAFADLVLKGVPPVEAALQAWQGIQRKTAWNKSSMMGKDEEVQSYIREMREAINKETQAQIDAELQKDIDSSANKKAGTILTTIRKRQILDEIATGKKMFEKVIIIDGKIKRVKCKPTPQERLKAIEIDNKMSGDTVQAKPNQVAKAQEIEKVIIVEDETQPGVSHNDEGK